MERLETGKQKEIGVQDSRGELGLDAAGSAPGMGPNSLANCLGGPEASRSVPSLSLHPPSIKPEVWTAWSLRTLSSSYM